MSRPRVADVLASLAGALREAGVRWYVFGAQAVLAYGMPRLTADVDVTVDAAGRSNQDVLRLLDGIAIRARTGAFDDFLVRSRLLPLVHEPSGMAVDVVLAGSGIEQDFLARAVMVELSGVAVPVLCVEDLIATKVVAGRRKDREDILGILEQGRQSIDLDRLRAILAAFDAGLEEPRATARFERIHRSFLRPKRPR